MFYITELLDGPDGHVLGKDLAGPFTTKALAEAAMAAFTTPVTISW